MPSGQATLCFGKGGGMLERAISVLEQLTLFSCALQLPFYSANWRVSTVFACSESKGEVLIFVLSVHLHVRP